LKKKKADFPLYRSPGGEIFTCIFFATKTPPGIEWYGFSVESKDKKNTMYYGLIDTDKKEMGFFTLKDLMEFEADITTDPDVINDIYPPVGWEKFQPLQIADKS
jgi:hypothetical protein